MGLKPNLRIKAVREGKEQGDLILLGKNRLMGVLKRQG